MLIANSLKSKLVAYIKTNGILYRKEAHQLARKWHFEPSNAERRLRELKNEVGIVPLNDELLPAYTSKSEHIVAWGWKSMTVFN